MRVRWETEQVSRCRTPREWVEREWEARVWQGNSRENLEGGRGEVVRGKGNELAAHWASLWTGGKRLGIQNFGLFAQSMVVCTHMPPLLLVVSSNRMSSTD